MKVGLDAFTLCLSETDPNRLLDLTRQHGLEVMHFSSRLLSGYSPSQIDEFTAKARECNIELELGGMTFNPGRVGKSVDELAAEWMPLFGLATQVGSPILNTSFGLIKERLLKSPNFNEQVAMSTELLKRLAPVAADHDVTITIELHVDLTSYEILRVLEQVGSPNVAVNLDTANACGMVEDPVDAAKRLAPYTRTTHFKDCNIYPVPGGYHWVGGAVLGRGVVDLPAIAEVLYAANPDISLNLEDSGGYHLVPIENEEFLSTLSDLTVRDTVRFMSLLRRGEQLVRSGIQPTPAENEAMDWRTVVAGRLDANIDYMKRLRDDLVSKNAAKVNKSA